MDTEDVSFEENIAAVLEQAKASAQRAIRRKGEMPKDHIPPFLQVQMHMLQHESGYRPDETRIITTQIPTPYLPCTVPVAELTPILISEVRLETHHRGRMIVVRPMVPPNRMNAVMAIVEDAEGTAILLQVYQQPEEAVVSAQETLRQGCFYLLKEPYFKTTNSERTYSLRVDHVCDIVGLSDDDDLIPYRWRRSMAIIGTSESIRTQGNEAVGKKRWAEAGRLYTCAIEAAKTTEDKQLAYLNRSLVNLRLGRPAKALSDAVMSGSGSEGKRSEKALFREASALYQLGKFDECLKELECLTAAYAAGTSSGEAKAMTARVEARLHEQRTGQYNYQRMYKQAEATPPIIDCATYSSPVEVRPSHGRGRGLFTTRKVSAGELLLCEKAFEYAFVVRNATGSLSILINIVTGNAVAGSQASLLAQLVQKQYHDPEAARLYKKLHHGDYKPPTVTEVDGEPVVDSFLTERVMSLNVFGAPRATRFGGRVRKDSIPAEQTEEASAHHTTGIWYLASYINHSCVSNCQRSFIGDVQIVRATSDMDEGTELHFVYKSLEGASSYDDMRKGLSSWGFVCSCAMCLELKTTAKATIAKRKSLKQEIKRAMGANPEATNIAKTLRLLQQFETTYPPASTGSPIPRTLAGEAYFALGQAYLCRNKDLDAAEVILKGFEALGFVIVACPRGGTTKAQPNCLRIDRWGLGLNSAVNAFLHLSQAYETLAREQSKVALGFAKTAYRMMIGEDVTFLDTYPELK